ncbi:hypothetical protein uth001_18060 [Clostridium butyricum]|uniref:Uncharacterized protein n=1 Tax=Clostridium butyricum TaxID=1492 RepID=A0A512TIM3_CLOBU|nr:hypothetical protein CBU02nite_05610 [Clostridium butyricum]
MHISLQLRTIIFYPPVFYSIIIAYVNTNKTYYIIFLNFKFVSYKAQITIRFSRLDISKINKNI